MQNVTQNNQDIRTAWARFVAEAATNCVLFAVTLVFNPRISGIVAPVFRVLTSGRRLPIRPGQASGGGPVTVGYRSLPVREVQDRTYDLWGRVDRELFGPRFHKSSTRTSFRGFIEHPDTNAHVHLGWSVPVGRGEEFVEIATDVWKRLVPSGSIVAEEAHDPLGWGHYCVTEQVLWDASARPDLFVESRRRD